MSLSFRSLGAVAAATTLLSTSASAQIMQPDGTLIPRILGPTSACTSGLNVGACLNDNEVLLGGAAGTIDAIHAATIDKETFDPKCQLTFKILSKGGSSYQHVFGWYPAKGGNTPPPLADLHIFLTCMDCQMPGTTKTLTLPAGVGAVGFFSASFTGGVMAGGVCPPANADTLPAEPTYTAYTERRFNGKLRNGNPDPMSTPNFIRVLTWQSVANTGSFYFGWEDDSSTGSDNNFNDLVTWVSGIECSGGGAACDTGMKGLCANGTKQCRAGVLTCVPDQMPIPEKCNAIDDNCDGVVDEGDLCNPGFVCFRGTCVPNCARGEFLCNAGAACEVDAGVCVDAMCLGVTCPAGQVCQAGKCIGECVGVKCPWGQACQHGGCSDVCGSIKCDDGFACTVTYPAGPDKDPVGVCSNCGCQGCGASATCTMDHCVPNDCAQVSCGPGTHCDAGSCVDNCAGGVACPVAQKCDKGQCVADGSALRDGGSRADGAGGGPVVIVTTGSTGTTTAGGPVSTGTTGAGSGGGGSTGARPAGETSSCGCRLPGGRSTHGAGLLLCVATLASLGRRRDRRATSRI